MTWRPENTQTWHSHSCCHCPAVSQTSPVLKPGESRAGRLPVQLQGSLYDQVCTSEFPIRQPFQSSDPEEPSFQAENECKHSSHLPVCGLLRHKQITQPGQTHEVPVSTSNGDRANYDLACLRESEMSLVLGSGSPCQSPMRQKRHLDDFRSHRHQEQDTKGAARSLCYTGNLKCESRKFSVSPEIIRTQTSGK